MVLDVERHSVVSAAEARCESSAERHDDSERGTYLGHALALIEQVVTSR